MTRIYIISMFYFFFVSCADDRLYVEPESENDSLILGTWTTEGEDIDYGSVLVEMRLMDSGRLTMILFIEGGSQRSFPGSWLIDEDELVLSGRYFGTEGESRVSWQINDEGVLLLRDESGSEQNWSRKKAIGSTFMFENNA